jgi:hypothetical protein
MTIEEAIAQATSKGYIVKYGLGEDFIGFNKPVNHTYHWFDKSSGELNFDHTYDSARGKTNRGVMHGIKVKKQVFGN